MDTHGHESRQDFFPFVFIRLHSWTDFWRTISFRSRLPVFSSGQQHRVISLGRRADDADAFSLGSVGVRVNVVAFDAEERVFLESDMPVNMQDILSVAAVVHAVARTHLISV